MNDEPKKLEAIGDALVLAVARLYLTERHPQIPYTLYTPLVALLVRNKTLDRIAHGEGIHFGDHAADAFEREIASRFYREGFGNVRAWLWSLFDKYVDVREEARRLTDPQATDALFRIVRGALCNVIKGSNGKITEQNADGATKQIVSRLMKSEHA
jgi:dsRNA-specific ribonuclease